MRAAILLICCSWLLNGCGGKAPPTSAVSGAGTISRGNSNDKGRPIITPGGSLPGKVVSVNTNGRFAVLRFPLGEMPKPEERLALYRDGLKVGEIRISGPQRDTHTVADVIAGECRVGDEVRAH